MKKTRILLCLLLASVLLLSACGKQKPSEPTAPDAQQLSALSAEKYGKRVVFPNEDCEMTCVRLDGERENEPAFDGYGTTGDNVETIRLGTSLKQKGEAEPVFDIVISLRVFAELGDRFEITAKPLARLGDKWLFSIHYAPDDNDGHYIFDTAENTLSALGEYCAVMYFGERLFLTPMIYGEPTTETSLLCDWSGSPVTVFDGVTDANLYDDTLYMLRSSEPCCLDAVSAEKLADPTLTPLPERICDFGPFTAAFSGEDRLVIQPLSGGYPTTCLITDAAATVKALKDGLPVAEADIKEACDVFSVTLPAWWADKYVCERTTDSLRFYYKAEKDMGGKMDAGFLFHIFLTEAPEDYLNAGLGGLYDLNILGQIFDPQGRSRFLAIETPDADYFEPEHQEEVRAMLDFTRNVEASMAGENGCRLKFRDYTEKYSVYAGTDDAGATLKLVIESVRHCTLEGYILRGEDYYGYTRMNAVALMFGDKGVLTWHTEDEDGAASYGGGSLELPASGDAYLVITGEGDVGTEAKLQPVYVPEPWERIEMTGKNTAECEWFSLTLPDSWKGYVECRPVENGLSFYHLPSEEAGWKGFLFSLYVGEESDDSLYSFLRRYKVDGKTLALIENTPFDMMAPMRLEDQYSAFADGVSAVISTVRAEKPGATIEKYDNGFRGTEFFAETARGVCRIFLKDERKDFVSGTLTFENDDEYYTYHVFYDATDGVKDFFFSITDPEPQNETEDDYGSCDIRFEGDGFTLQARNGSRILPDTMTFSPGLSR